MVQPATVPNGTQTNPLNLTPEVQQAFDDFYTLDFAAAQTRFENIERQHPDSPMAVAYVLNNTVFAELYRLDLLDTTLYVRDGFLSGKHPVVEDKSVGAKVDALAAQAIELSNKKLGANPKDVDALFARGYATGLQCVYMGMVEKHYIPALRLALAARKDNDEVLRLDPKYVDAYLAVGVHEYVIGSLAFPFKVLAGIVGLHGSKSKGLNDLRRVSRDGTINSVAASTSLALFLRREARYPEAIKLMQRMERKYPRNFLFSLEVANLLKDSGEGPQSIAAYRQLLAQAGKPGFLPDPRLELAWYGLGEAMRGQRQIAGAAEAYENAADQETASPLMKRRAHLASGEMYDLLHERAQAEKQYDAVLDLGAEFSQAQLAKKYKSEPYTGV